ncbi:hypothetical protein YC2023_103798 [Brassica napus]
MPSFATPTIAHTASYYIYLLSTNKSRTQDDRDNCSKERVLDRVFDLDTELGMESCKLCLVKAKEVGKISEETRIFWKFLQNFDGRHERESNQMDQVAQEEVFHVVREIMSRHELFSKPKIGSHSHVFLSGLINHDGPEWSKYRSILNPAFRIDNLKILISFISFSSFLKRNSDEFDMKACGGVCGTVASKNVVWSCVSRLPASWCGGGDLAAVFILHTRFRESRFIFLQLHRWSRVEAHGFKSILPALNSSCKEMLEEWEKLASAERTVELDSWTYCHDLTRNMLARASFGDSYKDGTKSFEIQQEQIDLGLRALRSVYIPGSK